MVENMLRHEIQNTDLLILSKNPSLGLQPLTNYDFYKLNREG